MEKRISFFEFQSVKSVAKAIDPHIREQLKIKSQIERLAEQYKKEQADIDALESGVVQIIGFHVDDLVKKVIETTEKDGKTIKTTKYLPTDIVSYDNATKQFIITIPDENTSENTVENVVEETHDESTEEITEENLVEQQEENSNENGGFPF